ncbi:MAG: chorismate-binding protein [Pseudomonadota bacterium]|nr:chorismate-binding protein [Pseudomonadota bacterium]
MFDRAIVRNAKTDSWLVYEHCKDVLLAAEHSAVLSVLNEAEERSTRDGLYAVGYVAYEASHAFDHKFPKRDIDLPLACFALFATETSITSLTDLYSPDEQTNADWHLLESRESFESKVDRIKSMIGAGEVYQINLTSRMSNEGQVTLADFARWSQDMPHAVFMSGPEVTVCSASPELFFEREDGVVCSKPMKGTVGRKPEALADEANAHWLQTSTKNRAENVMITDMVRNDLARLSSTGKVSVDELFGVERYPSVWQMTSTVKTEVSASIADIFKALFPAASITGAPKHAAVDVIDGLEDSPRELYTGALGIIQPSGFASFNVAIRTAWGDSCSGKSRFGVGCGIVWDSDPSDEFEELQTKARILKQPDPGFHLFETMRISEGRITRLARHLSRLENSAQYWCFGFDRQAVESYLHELVSSIDSAKQWRLRLQLNRCGTLSHSLDPFFSDAATADSECVPLLISPTPVESTDPFIIHKTSRREAYERAVTEVPKGVSPLLVNEMGHVTESAIANVVYQMEGSLFTPPITDGLLPGVLRDELIDEGTVSERSLPLADIEKVESWWLINSLRGWRRCELTQS